MHRAAQNRVDWLRRVALGAFLLAMAAIANRVPYPPSPLSVDAPAREFSAARAFVHVQSIARRPHPTGSDANAEVRDYISTQLRALGLAVESQSFSFKWRDKDVTGVNLLTRVPGAEALQSGRAVALVCHYDSVPTAPGASDDGAAVATLLETARALKSNPALKNEIILLFTDAEEAGLDGARAFAASSPWLKTIGLALNFEGRGASGPVVMFESSTGNGALIREFARAAPRPVANSLMYEVYRRMPNDTDLTVFKQAKVPGMNFGFIGEPEHYHAPTDDPAHLSKRTLQHEGSYALSLARHFGNVDLSTLNATDAVYFDLLGRVLVWYPGAWAIPFAALAAVVFLTVTFLSVKRRATSLSKLLLGVLTSAAILVIVGVLFRYGLNSVSSLFRGPRSSFNQFASLRLWVVSVGLTLTICIASQMLLRRWLNPLSFALGALCWWLVLTIVTTIWVPGASYLFLWPLIFGFAALMKIVNPWFRFAWLAGTALPALMLASPLVYQFYVALGVPALFVPMLVLALEIGALSPQSNEMFRPTTA